MTNFQAGNKRWKRHRNNSELKSEINITPLVDVIACSSHCFYDCSSSAKCWGSC